MNYMGAVVFDPELKISEAKKDVLRFLVDRGHSEDLQAIVLHGNYSDVELATMKEWFERNLEKDALERRLANNVH